MTEESTLTADQEVDLPEYIPIAQELLQTLPTLKSQAISSRETENLKNELLQATTKYFDALFPEDLQILTNSLSYEQLTFVDSISKSLDKINVIASENRALSTAFDQSKNAVERRAVNEPELSLSNIGEYKENTGRDRREFSRIFEDFLNEIEVSKSVENDQDSLFVKNAAFVINHPTQPLPNDDNNDDLEIEGGTIKLTCPLSMQMFKTPYISDKCGHTFDLDGIKSIWEEPGFSQDCPIPGCAATLTLEDFKPDRLMSLRIKSFNRVQKHAQDAEEVEKL